MPDFDTPTFNSTWLHKLACTTQGKEKKQTTKSDFKKLLNPYSARLAHTCELSAHELSPLVLVILNHVLPKHVCNYLDEA